MEIEAKFRIPDEKTLERLLQVTGLAGYELGEPTVLELHDRYLDTAQRRLLAAGYSCRLRSEGERTIATLKGLGAAEGAVHRRVEHEVDLEGPLPPVEWPAGPARDLALRLCAGDPLLPLLDLRQVRHSRRVSQGERAAAELSLDRVRVQLSPDQASGAGAEEYLELELELLPHGTEDDLRTLSAVFEAGWGLAPQHRSKFDRALALLASPEAPDSEPEGKPHLTPEERIIVERLAGERAVLARRAQMLLAWDDGLSVADMHDRSGLSPRRGRYWRWAFRQKRLGIFPGRALRAAAEGRPVPARPKDRRGVPPAPVKARPAAGVPAAAAPTARERVLAAELLKRPGVEPDDPMAEAGRKTLRFHFQRVLQHEAGTRQGEDIEALHDMRVATRRMRAAFRVFEQYFDPDVVAPFLKGLRRAGQALGAVRDLDVFRDTVRAYQAALPPPQQGGLDPFLAELEMRREAARQEMIAYLDSGKFGRFVERFAVFAETPGMGSRPLAPDGNEPRPYRVRHVAPMAIYERLAEVRAYGEWIASPDVPLARLHALRIDTKRLRYALEFFQEVLGTEARPVIRDTVAVQDHLGLIQDGVVASGILRDFLVWGTWGAQVEGRRTRSDAMPIMAPGVATYLAVRQSEVQQLVASFPQVWQRVTGPEFSRGLAAAVGVL